MPLDDFKVSCTKWTRIKQNVPPFGFKNIWASGDEFKAGIVVKSDKEELFAGQIEGVQYYSVYVDIGIDFEVDDVLFNSDTGKYMRVASMGHDSPRVSTLNQHVFYAEYIETLPE